ncbi:site-specific integrase [Brevibacillus invocatus]|uniref:site-specific integrase n=1 Tax=Brevibacillus invocatus TaxID=173959 RepID=UPI00203A494A|nr:site-specific integrase [Brevibacillus invocatus]MCM3079633.1 phage integrase N-terminal SAM-like domain-containing protein [Brevibacillus invocatus]MCM3431157.1 phage integrase N-terminal SAM-like domain-containing protein [Brevibacillus invocatus]
MDVIQQFEEYLVENGIVPKTIESHVGEVKAFGVFLEGMGVEQSTGLKHFYISSYKNHLMENKYAMATINKKIDSLQAFNPLRPYLVDLIKANIRSEWQANKHNLLKNIVRNAVV